MKEEYSLVTIAFRKRFDEVGEASCVKHTASTEGVCSLDQDLAAVMTAVCEPIDGAKVMASALSHVLVDYAIPDSHKLLELLMAFMADKLGKDKDVGPTTSDN